MGTRKSVQDELVQFKIMLLRAMPFYGDILTRLTIVENNAISTAATDGLRIMYNKSFMESLKPEEQNFVFMHEVFHVLLMHTRRKKERDPQLWNIAADIMVNDMLVNQLASTMDRMGIPFKAPSSGVFAQVGYGIAVEDIYQTLVEDNKYNNNLKGRSAKGGNTKGAGKDGDNNNGDSEEGSFDGGSGRSIEVRDRYYKYGNYKMRRINASEDLKPSLITRQIGDSLPVGEGLTGAYRDAKALEEEGALEEIIKGLVREASTKDNAGRSAFGGYFVPEVVLDLTKGRTLNWKELLKKYVTQKQSDDCSYATPERKYIHMDLIIPGHCEEEEVIEEIWAFVDTSGSISIEQLQSFLRQLYVIVKEYNCVLNLAYWDTEVTEVYEAISSAKELESCMPHHSGGTDINCVYEWLNRNHKKPDVMLILTDGYYGTLMDQYKNSKLRRNTLLVLNSNIAENEYLTEVGRITRLEEDS